MFYFAYGSNMKHKQMENRCPSSNFLRRAYLDGYHFVYDGHSSAWNGAVANIVKSNSSNRIWGGLFEINSDNLAALDCYEGYPKSYDRVELDIKDDRDTVYRAIVYFRTDEKLGKPSDEYRKTILRGSRDCDLPMDYVRILDK